jgi:hypothetical protein
MSPPLPFRQPPLSGKQKTARYFIGIGLGFLPVLVAVAFVSIAGGVGGDIASTLYNVAIYGPCLISLVVLGLMIYFLTQERLRPIGYGLLTVIVALPVIAGVSCIVLLSNSSF